MALLIDEVHNTIAGEEPGGGRGGAGRMGMGRRPTRIRVPPAASALITMENPFLPGRDYGTSVELLNSTTTGLQLQ